MNIDFEEWFKMEDDLNVLSAFALQLEKTPGQTVYVSRMKKGK